MDIIKCILSGFGPVLRGGGGGVGKVQFLGEVLPNFR